MGAGRQILRDQADPVPADRRAATSMKIRRYTALIGSGWAAPCRRAGPRHCRGSVRRCADTPSHRRTSASTAVRELTDGVLTVYSVECPGYGSPVEMSRQMCLWVGSVTELVGFFEATGVVCVSAIE